MQPSPAIIIICLKVDAVGRVAVEREVSVDGFVGIDLYGQRKSGGGQPCLGLRHVAADQRDGEYEQLFHISFL